MTPQGSADPAPPEQTVPAGKWVGAARGQLARLSIQSKIMVMLLVSSLGVAGGDLRRRVRVRPRTLLPVAAERMTQLREGQKRAIEMLFADLSNSLVDLQPRIDRRSRRCRLSPAGFDQLANAPIDPGQQQALENFYTDKLIKPIQQATGKSWASMRCCPTTTRRGIFKSTTRSRRRRLDPARRRR